MRKLRQSLMWTGLSLYLLVMSSVFLTSCTPIDGQSVIESLFPNLWLFLMHVFATVVLLIIMIWLVYKPTKDSLKKRSEFIQKQIDDAQQLKLNAMKDLEKANETKIQAFNEANEIINNAKEQAYLAKEKIENEAKQVSKQIEIDANNEALKIKERMNKEMNEKIIDIAFSASAALLKKEVSNKDNQKFVDDFIKSIEKQK